MNLERLSRGVGALAILAVLGMVELGGCDRLALPGWQGGPERQVTQLDGVTQSTPLIVGTIVDAAGRPVAGARVRVFEGFRIGLDGVTQSTPLEGVTQTTPLNSTGSAGLDGATQTTPLDGVMQTTPLEGVTQATPLDGVTQTTPLQTTVESRSDGTFAVRVPDRAVLSLEASRDNGDRAAILNMPIDRKAARVDVGRLIVAQPGSLTGRVVGPPGLDLAGTAVFVPGTDLIARTDSTGAYTLAGVPARIVAVAAVKPRYRPALARFLTVLPGKATTAPDLVLVPAKPRLDAIEPHNAGPGAIVTLRGADFGAAAFTPVEVRFGSLKASTIGRTGDNNLLATVPSGARTSQVVVIVEGVASNPIPFTAIGSVSIEPLDARVHVSEPVPITVRAWDTEGRVLEAPALRWKLEPADLGTLVPGEPIRALRPGFGQLTAQSGRIAAVSKIGFGEWRLQTLLSLEPGDPEPREGPVEGNLSEVSFGMPGPLAVLPEGGLAFADRTRPEEWATRIRTVDLETGTVRKLVGTGAAGYNGDGLPLRDASLGRVEGLAIDEAGNLLLADGANLRLRIVPEKDRFAFGRPLVAGKLWDLVGNGNPGPKGFGQGGEPSTNPLGMAILWPTSVAFDPRGSVLWATPFNEFGLPASHLLEISQGGVVRVLVTSNGTAGPEDRATSVIPSEFQGSATSLVCDSSGNVFMGTDSRVWMLCRKPGTYFGVRAAEGEVVAIAGTGQVTTRAEDFQGDEGRALDARLRRVAAMVFTGDRLVISDHGFRRIREIDRTGRILTIAGGGRGRPDLAIGTDLVTPAYLAITPKGVIYLADPRGKRIVRLKRSLVGD